MRSRCRVRYPTVSFHFNLGNCFGLYPVPEFYHSVRVIAPLWQGVLGESINWNILQREKQRRLSTWWIGIVFWIIKYLYEVSNTRTRTKKGKIMTWMKTCGWYTEALHGSYKSMRWVFCTRSRIDRHRLPVIVELENQALETPQFFSVESSVWDKILQMVNRAQQPRRPLVWLTFSRLT